MVDRIAIERASREQDATGGVIEDYQVVYEDVPARLALADERGFRIGSEAVFSSRLMQEANFLMSVAHDQDIDQRDRVRFKGEVYEIVGLIATSSFLTAKRALLRRVR